MFPSRRDYICYMRTYSSLAEVAGAGTELGILLFFHHHHQMRSNGLWQKRKALRLLGSVLMKFRTAIDTGSPSEWQMAYMPQGGS